MVSLAVDKVSAEPGVGDVHKPITHTTGALFLGGHRFIQRARGLQTRESFVGCIKNVQIKDKIYQIDASMKTGHVSIGYCPTN